MANTTNQRIRRIVLSTVIPVIIVVVILFVAVIGRPIISLIVSQEKSKNSIQHPKVTCAEFPFKITYKVGDEIITVEDTYVCEFKRIGKGFDVGPYRQWEIYIKGTGKDYITVIDNDEAHIGIALDAFDDCLYGGEYYEEWNAFFVYRDDDGNLVGLDEEAALLQGLEIISLEHADPIDALYDDNIPNYAYRVY